MAGVPSTKAAALNAGFIPDDEGPGPRDRPRNRISGATPRPRQGPRPRAPRPSPARSGAALTLVPARRSERAKCPKRRRSARAPCSTTPKAHRKHTGNTTKTPGHRLVSWRHPRHRGFNLLRFGQIRPNKHGPHESSSREFLLSHNRRPTLHHRPVDRELRPRGRIEVH